MAETRDMWIVQVGNEWKPAAPNTPGAKHVLVTYADDGNVYQQDWIGPKNEGGIAGIGGTTIEGHFGEPYWVGKEEEAKSSWPRQFTISGTRYQQDSAESEPYPIAGSQNSGKYITDKYGNQVLIPPAAEPPGGVGPLPQPKVVYEDPSAGLQRQQDEADLEYKRRLAANVGARAPRYADEEQLAQLQVQKAQRDLMNPFLLKQQQIDELIGTIQDQLYRKEITPQQATEMMAVARQNLDASLRGTTPWQMESDRKTREEDARNNRLTLAEKLLQSQGQMGGSLATGLLNSLTGGYGKIIGSAFQGGIINPLEMTRAYMNEFGAGPELNDLAKGLLSGYLRQQPPQQPQGGI